MTYTLQLAATMPYWLPVERVQRERDLRRAQLVTEARAVGEPATPEPRRRRSFVPRLAGALGLV